MSRIIFKKHLLATSIAVATCGAATPVLAAETESAKKDVEVIQVSGIRGSLKANVNAKRFADSVVDVITADDIGKFPDKNVAESLSRVTGVAVSREFGEGEKITIRGSGANQNRALLNGQNVATADWFILDNPSRGFNFTLLPSSLVKALEVYKTPEADVDEGSIGGTIVLKTRKPLELDANTFKVGIQGQYSETSEKTDPQVDVLYSWKNEEEDFGALVSITKQDRFVQREGLEVLGWTDGVIDGLWTPKDIGNPVFKQERERETIFASLQWAPSDNLDLTLNILDSSMDANNNNANLLIRPQNDQASEFSGVQTNGDAVYAGTVTGAGAYEWDFINRESSTETSSYDLEINYEADDYTIHAQIGTTEAKGGTYNETSWSFIPNVDGGYSFDLSGKPTVNVDVDPTNGELWGQNWTWGGNKPTTDEETYAQIDLDIPVEYGVFTSVKFGAKYRDHDRAQGRQAYSWHGPQTSSDPDSAYMWDIFEQCPTLASCAQSNGTHNVASNVVNGNVVNQLQGNRDAFWELGFGEGADYAVSNVLGEIWEINESILALYAKGSFEGEGFRGNMGLRIVQTDQTSQSYNFSSDSWGFHTVDREWLTPSQLDWVSEDRSYTEVLPSFNVAFDAADDQILRFGAARVMARANFSDLAPITTTSDLNGTFPTGTAGNPGLAPTIADQFDVSWEWYFDDAALFSATYFYKDVASYRTMQNHTQQFFNDSSESWVDVSVNRPVNGLGGATDGIEIGYQQEFGDFGVLANFTYTNAKNNQEGGLVEGASKNMYNLTAFYENENFGARLMYNHRTEWYKGVNWTGAQLWNDDYGQLDFSSSYTVSENVSVVFEAVNLTDEEIVEYDTNKNRLMSIYQNGRRFVVGLNLSF